jgi:tetratricopeptide (TPR) repeat protein
MVAALFALHPLQVDTVAWVAERKNVLSTFFALLSLSAYVRYAMFIRNRLSVISNQSGASERGQPPITDYRSLITPSSYYSLALLLFAIGLMCKPAIVTLPCVLLLLDYWPLNRCERLSLKTSARLVLEKVPFFPSAAGSALITVAAHEGIRTESDVHLPLSWRLGNAVVSYARYLGKVVWPANLAVFYPHPLTWPPISVAGSCGLLLVITGLVIWQWRRRPHLVTGWFWFVGVLLPMIGIVEAGAQAMADRFAYVPLIGLFIALVWGLVDLACKSARNALTLELVGLATIVACSVVTSRQLRFWQDSVSLFEHAIDVTGRNYSAEFSLGNALADKGRLADAMKHWEAALEIVPVLPEVQCRIASALGQKGDFAGAIARYRLALESNPNLHEALNNLAWMLATCPDASLRNGVEAVKLALQACELTRYERPIMIGTLAAAYAEAGRFDEAVATARRAIATARADNEPDLAESNTKLLEEYQAKHAHHESMNQ